MKTKAEIVQELLDKNHITAEDAVVLLMGSKEKEYVYIPQPYPVYPSAPYNPFAPIWYSNPFPNYSTTNGEITVSVN